MLNRIKESCEKFPNYNAFCINDRYYTYYEFAQRITAICNEINRNNKEKGGLIGVFTHNDIDTYSAIFATIFAGFGFVPLNHKYPVGRNREIVQQAEITTIISVKSESDFLDSFNSSPPIQINTSEITSEKSDIRLTGMDDNNIVCILFTSGSTGIPKGVPYSLKNINSTLDAFFALDYNLDENDRFLQMFDLTFDMSLLSYLTALCIGASVYTVDDKEIKYLSAYKIMRDHDITFAAMVPTTLSFLQPYFKDINLDKLRYSVLGGEPFYVQIAIEWANCIPNARIINISGPTEITMACMGYELSRDPALNKSYKGVLSFGKPWKNTTAIVVDENLQEVQQGITGDLCFSGDHVMKGYWKNTGKNKELFLRYRAGIEEKTFYRTGDLTFVDKDGDYMSCGRTDHQVKVQGFRVELSEIEHVARQFCKTTNVAAVTYKNSKHVLEIHLFIESREKENLEIVNHLRSRLPFYMIPSGISYIDRIPLNKNGKIDRAELKKMVR